MGSRQGRRPDNRPFAARVIEVIDGWLAGRMADAEAAAWAFQNTDFVQKYGTTPEAAEQLWRALGALAMLSSCQPDQVRSTRQEVQRARRALAAGLGKR